MLFKSNNSWPCVRVILKVFYGSSASSSTIFKEKQQSLLGCAIWNVSHFYHTFLYNKYRNTSLYLWNKHLFEYVDLKYMNTITITWITGVFFWFTVLFVHNGQFHHWCPWTSHCKQCIDLPHKPSFNTFKRYWSTRLFSFQAYLKSSEMHIFR